jgi:transposase InsO family protein
MISVHEAGKLTLEQIVKFLGATEEVRFEASTRAEVYAWVERLLCQQEYSRQGRAARSLIRRYIGKMTGLSRAQVTRLIARYVASGQVRADSKHRHCFPRRYTEADIALLARVDEAHETLSGPATRRILQREFHEYGKAEFQPLATISNGHLYNLRRSSRYRQRLRSFAKTRPSPVSIGERRKPDPQGRPGFLRVDTVHQGDGPNGKGVYHINAVDEVTQWEIAAAVPRISEAYLEPALQAILSQFPFVIHGFHSDNGSEFINQTVAKQLNKLMIAQTKSRPRHCHDNGLAETKNGEVIRKHMGWGFIDASQADRLQHFYTAHLNPYLNYHRPCAQAEIEIASKGRKRRRYRRYQTPLETLLALPKAQQYLPPGLTLATLQRIGKTLSDTEAARRMQEAKHRLFASSKTALAANAQGNKFPPATGLWK